MANKIKKLTFDEIKAARPTVGELKNKSPFPIVVVVENIRSLHNVGSIFRTSDGAFIETLYLCGYTGYPPRKEIDKTALGSVESVNWVHNENTVEVVKDLKSRGYGIVSLEHTDKSKPYNDISYDYPLCLIIGNEVDGISDEVIGLCDLCVDIPMHGIKQSLNVSVAYGIVVYHLVESYLKQNI
ncbi:RNA methyltransferase [Spirochaetota bacterium]